MKKILINTVAIVIVFVMFSSCTWATPPPEGVWEYAEANITLCITKAHYYGTIEIDGVTTKMLCYWDPPAKLIFGNAQVYALNEQEQVLDEPEYVHSEQEYFSGTFQYKQEKLHLKITSSEISSINVGDVLIFTKICDDAREYSEIDPLDFGLAIE